MGSLRQFVRYHLVRRAVVQDDFSVGQDFSNKMELDINMLAPLRGRWAVGQKNGGLVVLHQVSVEVVDWQLTCLQQVEEMDRLLDGEREGHILSLAGAERDAGLLFRLPSDWATSKLENKPCCRASV